MLAVSTGAPVLVLTVNAVWLFDSHCFNSLLTYAS